MVKQIVRDPLFLQQKSETATEADRQVITEINAEYMEQYRQDRNIM